MAFLSVLLTFLYVAVCSGLIFFVLIQASKGSGLSGAFGAIGGGESLFGATGSYTLVVKISVGLAIAFLFLSLLFGFVPKTVKQGVMDQYEADFITVEEADESFADQEAAPVSPGVAGSGSPSEE